VSWRNDTGLSGLQQSRERQPRYMTERATRDQMVGMGWLTERDGRGLVVMCAPQ